MASPAFSRITFILNNSSGWDYKDEDREHLLSMFHNGHASIEMVERGADIQGITRQAIREGSEVVVAGGGDGTVRAVAEAAYGSGAAVGLLPAGTINHFARDLDIPLDREAALQTLFRGTIIQVDAAEVNGRMFVNNCSIGLYPAYRSLREQKERKWRHRSLAVMSAAVNVFHRRPLLTVRLTANDKHILRRTPVVLVANNEHKLEGYELGTRARLDEGRLWIYILKAKTRRGLLENFAGVLAGRFRKQREMEYFSAPEVRIETGYPEIEVSLDGEMMQMRTPLLFRSLPGALRVVVPPETEK